MIGLFKKLVSSLGLVGEVIDKVHTSDEERLTLKAELMKIEEEIISNTIEYHLALMNAQSSIIQAEAKSESWLTRNWRPLTMLAFVAIILMNYFGVGPRDGELPNMMWGAIDIGLGGYIAGRSWEKVADLSKALKTKEEV